MLNQLRYFQSIVRLESFSKAAEENFISQSAISQQIQALERELGFQLFKRKNRSFTLTEAGAYFYQKSLVLLADYEQMCNEASKIANGSSSSLRIGYLRSFAGREFYKALEQFTKQYPGVDCSIQYGNHEELYAMLRSGTVDFIFNDQRRAFSDEYVNLILHSCESFVEISSDNPLAAAKGLSSKDLKNTPCILIASKSQQEIERDFYQTVLGFDSEFLFAENMDEARMMVIGRKGFLVLEGETEFNPVPDALIHIPLMRDKDNIRRNFCLFWKKESKNIFIEKIADLLKEQFEHPE